MAKSLCWPQSPDVAAKHRRPPHKARFPRKRTPDPTSGRGSCTWGIDRDHRALNKFTKHGSSQQKKKAPEKGYPLLAEGKRTDPMAVASKHVKAEMMQVSRMPLTLGPRCISMACSIVMAPDGARGSMEMLWNGPLPIARLARA
jgi:hypothetical protein